MPADIEIRRKYIIEEAGHPSNSNGAYTSYVSMKMRIGEKITSGTYADKYKVTVDYITYYSESYYLNGGSSVDARKNYPLCVLFTLCKSEPSATAQQWGPSAYDITNNYQQWTSKIPVWYTSGTSDKEPPSSVSCIFGHTNSNSYYVNNSSTTTSTIRNRVIEIARYTVDDADDDTDEGKAKRFRLNSEVFGASSYNTTYNAYKVDQTKYPGVGVEYVKDSGDYYVKDVNKSLYSRIYVTNRGTEFYIDTDDLSKLYAWTNTYLYGSSGGGFENSWVGWENAGKFSSWITTFTIKYNANGGTGAPSSQTKEYGATLTLSSTKPTRTGYKFNNWNTKSDGTGTSYASGGSYSANSDVTLYAQWTPISYTVKYYLDGTEQTSLKQTCNYNTTYTYKNLPSKTGHSVDGWWANSSGTGTKYAGGAEFSNLTTTDGSTIYRYSKSTPNTYTVHYNANGGSGAPADQTKTYGVDLVLSSTIPTRTGHTFVTWTTASDGTGSEHAPGSTYKANSALNLYALWTVNSYTVSYNANGGTGAPSAQTKTYGVNLTLSSTKPTKSFQLTYDPRSGTLPSGTTSLVTKPCTFNNWKATDGTTYSSGGSYTKNEGTILTAQWTNPTLGTLPTPTRSGYRFDGWYTAATSGTKVTASTTMSGDTTIYAHWVQQVTLTYNTNGGSGSVASETKDTGSEFTIKNYTGTKSENVTYYANGGSFSGNSSTTKAGNMVFNGWADSSSATTAQYIYNDPTKGTVTLTANKTIYGVWSHGTVSSHPTITAKQVTLTYNPNGGTIPTVADRTKKVNLVHSGWATTQAKADAGTVDYGVSAAIPTGTTVYAVWTAGAIGVLPTISIFTSRTGYRLDVDKPWTTTQNGSTAVTSTTKISVDTTIYAKWEYQITIDGRGGLIYGTKLDGSDISGVSSLSEWKKHGVNYTTPSTIIYSESEVTEDVPEGEDMADVPSSSRTFIGYATTSSGSKAYDPGFSYTANEPKTLYAVFQIKQYTVKFTDGYSNPEVVLKTQVVNHGSDATPPANPTRSGFTFSGWIGNYRNVMIDTTVKACWGFCPIWVKTPTGWRKYDPKED